MEPRLPDRLLRVRLDYVRPEAIPHLRDNLAWFNGRQGGPWVPLATIDRDLVAKHPRDILVLCEAKELTNAGLYAKARELDTVLHRNGLEGYDDYEVDHSWSPSRFPGMDVLAGEQRLHQLQSVITTLSVRSDVAFDAAYTHSAVDSFLKEPAVREMQEARGIGL